MPCERQQSVSQYGVATQTDKTFGQSVFKHERMGLCLLGRIIVYFAILCRNVEQRGQQTCLGFGSGHVVGGAGGVAFVHACHGFACPSMAFGCLLCEFGLFVVVWVGIRWPLAYRPLVSAWFSPPQHNPL